MAAQGERIPGGFILITGLDGIQYVVRPQSVGIIHDARMPRRDESCSFMGGMSFGYPARSTKCWRGSVRGDTYPSRKGNRLSRR